MSAFWSYGSELATSGAIVKSVPQKVFFFFELYGSINPVTPKSDKYVVP